MTAPEQDGRDPFSRYGWLMWATWMVFLAFPAGSVLERHDDFQTRAIGLCLVGLFAVVYALGSAGMVAKRSGSRNFYVTGLLLLIVFANAFVIGPDALGFVPFLTSFVVFALARPWNWWVAGLFVLIGVLGPFFIDAWKAWSWTTFLLIAVGAGVSVGRLMSDWAVERKGVEHELIVVAERERVARDVHDVLGHSLTVVAIKAELAEKLMTSDPERAAAELRDIQALSRQSLAEIRETVGGLRATRLDDELKSAGVALTGAGIEVELPADPDVLDPRYRPSAAWVVREAVTNVIRHSQAARCAVSLTPDSVTISDDGVGVTSPFGNGLRGLVERVEARQGKVRIGAGPDGVGTVVEVRW